MTTPQLATGKHAGSGVLGLGTGRREEIEAGTVGGFSQVEAEERIGEGGGNAGHDAAVCPGAGICEGSAEDLDLTANTSVGTGIEEVQQLREGTRRHEPRQIRRGEWVG